MHSPCGSSESEVSDNTSLPEPYDVKNIELLGEIEQRALELLCTIQKPDKETLIIIPVGCIEYPLRAIYSQFSVLPNRIRLGDDQKVNFTYWVK